MTDWEQMGYMDINGVKAPMDWRARWMSLYFGVPIGAPEQLDNNPTDKEDSTT